MQNVTQNIITLNNRSTLEVKGVKKVISLNTKEFNLSTNLGPLMIKGENLEMQNLDLDKGDIVIIGKIFSIQYTDAPNKTIDKSSNFFKKMFK